MNETALILPMPEVEALVSRYRDKYDPSSAAGVPAHVTLLYPFLAPDAIGAAEVTALTILFASSRPCDIAFTRCGRFDPKTLFLAPEPEGPLLDLMQRIAAHWPACPLYGGIYSDVVPHLTVSDSVTGEMLDRIEMAVASGLPVRARMAEAWLIENRTGRWEMRQRFALG